MALRANLEREIVALPEEERAAFRAELGMTEGALRVALHRALKQLARLRGRLVE